MKDTKNGMFGKKHSKETKIKMSKKAKQRKIASHWKGGKYKTSKGYILVLCHEHPFSNPNGYIQEHRLIMEAHLGRTLLKTEVVHHINGIKTDNRIENLMLFSSKGEHIGEHNRLRSKNKLLEKK